MHIRPGLPVRDTHQDLPCHRWSESEAHTACCHKSLTVSRWPRRFAPSRGLRSVEASPSTWLLKCLCARSIDAGEDGSSLPCSRAPCQRDRRGMLSRPCLLGARPFWGATARPGPCARFRPPRAEGARWIGRPRLAHDSPPEPVRGAAGVDRCRARLDQRRGRLGGWTAFPRSPEDYRHVMGCVREVLALPGVRLDRARSARHRTS